MSERLPKRARPRGSRLLGALLITVAGLVAPTTWAVAAPPLTATAITVTQVYTPSITVPDTPGAGAPYVVAGVPFTVDFATDAPLSTTRSTTVTLSVTSGPDAGAVTASVDVPKNVTSGSLTGVVLPTSANGVSLRVAVADVAVAAGTATLDVLKSSLSAPASSKLTGIGGGGGPGVPCRPTAADPTCGDLRLPESHGVLSDQLLSTGACAGVCSTTAPGAAVLQLLVAVDPAVYHRQNPIEFVAKCDKTLCPGKGIKTYSVSVQLTPGSAPQVSPPCPAKGVVGATQDFCTDYVQSSRDGAGDVLLYVELPVDAKIIW
jgi:hypothetical protein